jgi:hypothetical protein
MAEKSYRLQAEGFWLAGWLFTIGFVKLTFPQALLGLIIWPWYLGASLAG